jgi:hypothetical protein
VPTSVMAMLAVAAAPESLSAGLDKPGIAAFENENEVLEEIFPERSASYNASIKLSWKTLNSVDHVRLSVIRPTHNWHFDYAVYTGCWASFSISSAGLSARKLR